MGRRPTYSDKDRKEITQRLAKGEPLSIICADKHLPSYSQVWAWMQTEEAFAEAIAQARAQGHDEIAANTRRIAKGEEGYTSGDAVRDKLMVYTDLQLLAKWDPKRYGDRTTHEIEGRLETQGSLADHEAAAKLAAILEAVKKREG